MNQGQQRPSDRYFTQAGDSVSWFGNKTAAGGTALSIRNSITLFSLAEPERFSYSYGIDDFFESVGTVHNPEQPIVVAWILLRYQRHFRKDQFIF
jgi:hypothetical protein